MSRTDLTLVPGRHVRGRHHSRLGRASRSRADVRRRAITLSMEAYR